MANYRRASASGGTYFFTVITYRRRPFIDRPRSRRALREAIDIVRQQRPFSVDAWVLLPERIHIVWTLPWRVSDFSLRWSLIKSGFPKPTRGLVHVEG